MTRKLASPIFLTLALFAALCQPFCRVDAAEVDAPRPAKSRVYVGTSTRSGSQGIYHFELDLKTGQPTTPELAVTTTNPTFLTLHPNGKWLFSVNETSSADNKSGGMVNAFSMDAASGKLTLLNSESSKGAGPCWVVVEPSGKFLLATNYNSGSVAAFPIGADGHLAAASGFVQHEGSSANRQRQAGPHAHSVNLDPSGKLAIVADLGLDKLLFYRLGADGVLTPHDPPAATVTPGSGPRHFTFHPNGKFAYVINEIASTVTAFTWDGDKGTLKEIHTVSTLPEGTTTRSTTAEVQIHPSGKFLYGSNRGHDSIAMFGIDLDTGMLTPLGHQATGGRTPRNFRLDPTGTWLLAANSDSGTIPIFRIDTATGKLQATEQVVKVANPMCVKFFTSPQ